MEDLDEYYDFDNIMRRMLDKVSNDIDKREGSIIYDAIAPAAAEIAQMYIRLKDSIDLVFVDTAVDEYLDRLCNQIGLVRKQSTAAIKEGKFYDENNILIDIELGQRFTCKDLCWKVIEKVSKGTYKLKCETEGAVGNSISGAMIPVEYINNLSKAELTNLIIPGENTETDEELRQRYFETTNEKTFAGNIADYKKKTKELQGVGAVKVVPAWNGGGTVKLIILGSDYNKASNELINFVQEEICPNKDSSGIGLAPIGHSVTVDTVEELEINVSMNIVMSTEKEIKDTEIIIQNEIQRYLEELKKNWENEEKLIVRISQIESRILDLEEILDINSITINEKKSNIEVNSNKIPILGEVVINK